MKLNTLLTAVGNRIVGGTEFQWKCFGPNARYLDIADIISKEVVHIIYSTKTQEVFEVQVFVDEDDIAYRWMDPEYANSYFSECTTRSIDPTIAYDEVKFTDMFDEDEIIELAHKVVHNTYVHVKPRVEHKVEPKFVLVDDENGVEPDELMSLPNEYTVTINVSYVMSVNTGTMEEAVSKGKTFVKQMKPAGYPKGVAWSDSFVTKETVSRELVTETYED